MLLLFVNLWHSCRCSYCCILAKEENDLVFVHWCPSCRYAYDYDLECVEISSSFSIVRSSTYMTSTSCRFPLLDPQQALPKFKNVKMMLLFTRVAYTYLYLLFLCFECLFLLYLEASLYIHCGQPNLLSVRFEVRTLQCSVENDNIPTLFERPLCAVSTIYLCTPSSTTHEALLKRSFSLL